MVCSNASALEELALHLNNAILGDTNDARTAINVLLEKHEYGLLGSKYTDTFTQAKGGNLVLTHHDFLYEKSRWVKVSVPKHLIEV